MNTLEPKNLTRIFRPRKNHANNLHEMETIAVFMRRIKSIKFQSIKSLIFFTINIFYKRHAIY